MKQVENQLIKVRNRFERLHENRKKTIAVRLLVLTRKKRGLTSSHYIPAVSWSELGVPFQDVAVMDLRVRGILRLSGDGVLLCSNFVDMNTTEFLGFL